MIFAKVDVTLPHHHRVLRIPRSLRAAALGVWLAGLCYTRGNDLDGFVPGYAIDEIASEHVIRQLVLVGLFSAHEKDGVHGYLVHKYSEHNETKAQVEERRTRDRVRKKNLVHSDSTRKSDGFQEHSVRKRAGFQPQGIPDSDSDSGSVSRSGSLVGDQITGGSTVKTARAAQPDPPAPVELISPRPRDPESGTLAKTVPSSLQVREREAEVNRQQRMAAEWAAKEGVQ